MIAKQNRGPGVLEYMVGISATGNNLGLIIPYISRRIEVVLEDESVGKLFGPMFIGIYDNHREEKKASVFSTNNQG